jgi:hypothetical protein
MRPRKRNALTRFFAVASESAVGVLLREPKQKRRPAGGVFIERMEEGEAEPASIACSGDYKVALRYANQSFCNL